MITELYCDGGVISKNPSPIGGTWAFCLVGEKGLEWISSGYITPDEINSPTVTNNQTEMLALVHGLHALPDDFKGTIFSDSKVTLGRAFLGYKWENIPEWLHNEFREESKRLHLHDPKKIKWTLLAGHPTKAQLQSGIGRHGLPVSEYNVRCDEMCKIEAEQFLINLDYKLKSLVQGG